ncbi:MAG: hypothetical protein AAFO61_13200 [Pseudomonadota bacterium]
MTAAPDIPFYPALAFYVGTGTWVDWFIRLATRSRYSHVEMVLATNFTTGKRLCASSSGRDGGVRFKSISLKPEHWEIVPVVFEHDFTISFFEKKKGLRYDYLGILFCQFFNLHRHSRARWFCSEICAAALGFRNPHTLSPGLLKDRVEEMNQLAMRMVSRTN